jgi:hypothetical protein
MKLAHGIKGNPPFLKCSSSLTRPRLLKKTPKLLKKDNLENKDFIGLTLLLGDLHKSVQRMTNL